MPENLPMPVTAPFSRAQKAMLLNLVVRAAEAEIMPRFRTLDAGDIDAKSGPADLVTVADTAAEALITRGLQRAFPHAVIVGEEAGDTDKDVRAKLSTAELGFTIDPVDGTWNFARGLPAFGTMLSACRFGRPVFGLIYDPVGRDVIWADMEAPATWRTRQGHTRDVKTADAKPLSELDGYIELNPLPDTHKRIAMTKCLDLAHFGNLRCSAHHYRLLAQGAVDFNLATKLSPWDHAAGVLITQQSGGHCAMLDGTPYDTSINNGYLLCASSEKVWQSIAEHFAELLA
ncbi:MAG: inositol monophosphatase [Aliishimia sp.]